MKLVLTDPSPLLPTDWSGSHIIYQGVHDGERMIRALSVECGETIQLVRDEDASGGRLSPDGRFLAFDSSREGTTHVFVQTFPEAHESWKISSDAGGREPHWRGDGGELFYLAMDAETTLMARPWSSDRGPGQAAQPLFQMRTTQHPWGWNFDVTADGERFLVRRTAGRAEPEPLTMVLNWTAAPGG